MLLKTLQNPWRLTSTQRTVGNRGKLGKEGMWSPRGRAHQLAVQCQTALKTNIQITVYLGKNIYVCMQQKLIKKKGAINFKRTIRGMWEDREEGKEGKTYWIKLQS